jgi:PAS domain S-box-containing protein
MNTKDRNAAAPAPDVATLSPEELRARAFAALRSGEFDLAERAIARGDATWAELVENLRIYQIELQMQAEELQAAQQATQKALARFATLFAGLPLPALLIDADGVVQEANQQAERMFGLPGSMLRSYLFHRLVHPDDYQAEVRALFEDARVGGEAEVAAVRLRAAAARQTVGDLYVRALADEATGSPQYACVVLDRTNEMADSDALKAALAMLRARESENQTLGELAARAPTMVLLCGPERRIEWANDGFLRATGYTREEVHGRRPGELLQGPLTDPETVAYMRARLDAGEGFRGVEVLNYRKSGSTYWTELEVQVVRNEAGRITQYIALQSDITARRVEAAVE